MVHYSLNPSTMKAVWARAGGGGGVGANERGAVVHRLPRYNPTDQHL